MKWPAWSEASCRLSVKLRIFCASRGRSVFRIAATVDRDSSVVAVLRPSLESADSLRKSFSSRRVYASPHDRHSMKGEI